MTPEQLGGPPGHPTGLLDIRQASQLLPDIRDGLPTTPGHPGGLSNHSRIFIRDFHHSRTSGRPPNYSWSQCLLGCSRVAPGPLWTLPRRPRAVSNATGAPPGRFGRSRGANGPFRTLPRLPRAVSDVPEVPPGRFGHCRGTPKPLRTLPRRPWAVLDAPEAPLGRFGRSRGSLGPFWTLPRRPVSFRMLPSRLRAL